MKITEVKTDKSAQAFINVPKILYKNDPNYISPLDGEVKGVFDRNINPFFQHGECKRWILTDDSKKIIGRVAAFINYRKRDFNDQRIGGIGFFESINNSQAADLLFTTAENWLKSQGITEVQGPINFGENDKFWGLLVEGFIPASFGMNYNFPYYEELFKQNGYAVKYEQITNVIDLTVPFPSRFQSIANWVMRKPEYEFRNFDITRKTQIINDIIEVYNDGWRDFENFQPITYPVLEASLNSMKPIMDEKLIWLVYYKGQPISFIVLIPDANEYIKDVNGTLNLIGKIKFLINKLKGAKRIRAVVMGTKKAFQNHGIESALFMKLGEYVLPKNQYTELELSWVGDFNDKMLALHKATGSKPSKRHVTLFKHI